MSAKTENTPPKDTAAALFETTKGKFRRVLKHPFVPPFVEEQLRPVVATARILSNEDFVNEQLKTLIGPPTPERIQLITAELEDVNGICMSGSTYGKTRIFFRKRYLETDPFAVQFFPDLFAEELAHALSTETQDSLADLPDVSFGYLPYADKDELLAGLHESNETLYGDTKPFTAADITAYTSGFHSYYEHNQNGLFEIFPEQLGFEETRAAVIQTIFQSIMLGQERAPLERPDAQFHTGATLLSRAAQALPSVFYREAAGLHFLQNYVTKESLQQDIATVVTDFSQKTLDEVLLTLGPKQHDAFFQSHFKVEGNYFITQRGR